MFETPTYQVTGSQPVSDHKPGEIFEADLDPAVEGYLLKGGHLTRLDPARQSGRRRGAQVADEQAKRRRGARPTQRSSPQ